MARTTVDIDDPILRDLKRLQKRRGTSLGRLVSDLLADALAAEQKGEPKPSPEFRWVSRPLGTPRIDLRDKDALWEVLDEGARKP